MRRSFGDFGTVETWGFSTRIKLFLFYQSMQWLNFYSNSLNCFLNFEWNKLIPAHESSAHFTSRKEWFKQVFSLIQEVLSWDEKHNPKKLSLSWGWSYQWFLGFLGRPGMWLHNDKGK
jgi:hypothetical protein